jgi:hypothetical protein
MGYVQRKPTIIYQDNQSCIDITSGRSSHNASKHIKPKLGLVKDQIEAGTVTIMYTPTKDMVADILTKPLDATQHLKLTKLTLNEL